MLTRIKNKVKRAVRRSTKPSAILATQVRKMVKTSEVLVDPKVISDFFALAASSTNHERGALLLGRLEGRFAIVERCILIPRKGTATTIDFLPSDFEKAAKLADENQLVLGWAHSHPTYTAFLSGTDVKHQSQGQALFPDYLALVLDPFHELGANFAFFRVEDGRAVRIPHHFYIKEESDEA